jgi:hypothetical protein
VPLSDPLNPATTARRDSVEQLVADIFGTYNKPAEADNI